MRVLFYGTPAFAVPTLEALLSHHEVVGVVTQPDRPAHRGQRLTEPPVKALARASGIRVVQPVRLRDAGWPEQLSVFAPEVAVVVAFGQILPRAVLDVPARGSINVHGSVLPRYRGAAPIQWAIIRGETDTGITTFQMDPGMDTGPVLLSTATPIGPDETAGELAERLASWAHRCCSTPSPGSTASSLCPSGMPRRRWPLASRRAMVTCGGIDPPQSFAT